MIEKALRARALYLGLVGVVLIASACGSDNKASQPAATTSGGAQAATTAPATSAAATSAPATSAPASSAASSADVIKIGLVNTESGGLSLPEYRIGAELAADVVNQRGGMRGAKIQLDTCLTDGSPEGSINCANRLVEDKVTIAFQALDLAADAGLKTFADAGIPVVAGVAAGSAIQTDPNVFILGTATPVYYAAQLDTFAQQGATRFANLSEDTVTTRATITDVLEPLAKALGLDLSVIYADPAAADWGSVVASSLTKDPEVIGGFLSEPACTSVATAVPASGFKGAVFLGSCSNYIAQVGAASVGTYTLHASWIPNARQFAPPAAQKDLDVLIKAYTDSGNQAKMDGGGILPFIAMMDLAAIVDPIPASQPLTSETIRAALNAASGIPAFAGGALDCTGKDAWPGSTRACQSSAMVYQVVDSAAGPVQKPLFDDVRDYSQFASQLAK